MFLSVLRILDRSSGGSFRHVRSNLQRNVARGGESKNANSIFPMEEEEQFL